MSQVVQIVGSVLVLTGFAMAQRGMVDHRSRLYLLLNVLGSAALAGDALLEQQWGFLLLEGVWALVSAISLFGVLRARRSSMAG